MLFWGWLWIKRYETATGKSGLRIMRKPDFFIFPNRITWNTDETAGFGNHVLSETSGMACSILREAVQTDRKGNDRMLKYVLKRMGMALITILLVACATFLLMKSVPGSPWLSERNPSPSTLAALNEKYGLDKPVIVQLGMYLSRAVQGNFGESLKMQRGRPVVEIIRDMFPISAKIGAISLLWAVPAGLFIGCLAAYRRGRLTDNILRVVCTLGISLPSFVLATVLSLTFAGGVLRLLPASYEAGNGWSYVLPCFALGFYPMCYTARQTRSAMLDALNQEYVRTARAKGLKTPRILFRHALRNALIPVMTYLGPQVAFTFCGGFVVETIYNIPGLGRYFISSIQNRDYPLIMGTTIFLATFLILMNLLVDLCYVVADPRINLANGGE